MLKEIRSLVVLASLSAAPAFAAVPAEVTTAISDGLSDGKTIAYALLGFAIAIGVVMFIKRKAAS